MLFDDHVIDKSVNDGGVRAARERGSALCLFVCLQMISQLAAEAMEEALAQGVVVVGGTKGVIEWAGTGSIGGLVPIGDLGMTTSVGAVISEEVILVEVVGVILEVAEETSGVVGVILVEVGDLEEVQVVVTLGGRGNFNEDRGNFGGRDSYGGGAGYGNQGNFGGNQGNFGGPGNMSGAGPGSMGGPDGGRGGFGGSQTGMGMGGNPNMTGTGGMGASSSMGGMGMGGGVGSSMSGGGMGSGTSGGLGAGMGGSQGVGMGQGSMGGSAGPGQGGYGGSSRSFQDSGRSDNQGA